jgi:hypothetical protein
VVEMDINPPVKAEDELEIDSLFEDMTPQKVEPLKRLPNPIIVIETVKREFLELSFFLIDLENNSQVDLGKKWKRTEKTIEYPDGYSIKQTFFILEKEIKKIGNFQLVIGAVIDDKLEIYKVPEKISLEFGDVKIISDKEII